VARAGAAVAFHLLAKYSSSLVVFQLGRRARRHAKLRGVTRGAEGAGSSSIVSPSKAKLDHRRLHGEGAECRWVWLKNLP